MQVEKQEVKQDISRIKSIMSIANQKGGKIIIKALKKSIRDDLDIITSLASGDEIKLRTAAVGLKKDLELLKLMTQQKNLLDIAMDALKELEDEYPEEENE